MKRQKPVPPAPPRGFPNARDDDDRNERRKMAFQVTTLGHPRAVSAFNTDQLNQIIDLLTEIKAAVTPPKVTTRSAQEKADVHLIVELRTALEGLLSIAADGAAYEAHGQVCETDPCQFCVAEAAVAKAKDRE